MNVSSTTPTTIQMARLTAPPSLAFPLGLPEHPDQHRPERPILLAVDSRDVAPGGDQE